VAPAEEQDLPLLRRRKERDHFVGGSPLVTKAVAAQNVVDLLTIQNLS
jgi:hypothetical protein